MNILLSSANFDWLSKLLHCQSIDSAENALYDPFDGTKLYEANVLPCSISRTVYTAAELVAIQISNDLLQRSYFLKSGIMAVDESFLGFSRYLKQQFIDGIPCFDFRCLDGYSVMNLVQGMLLRDFQSSADLDPVIIARSMVRCALPLYLVDGADRHNENYIIGSDSILRSIDFHFCFGRRPKSASDCFGLGTTKELKNFLVENNAWELIEPDAIACTE